MAWPHIERGGGRDYAAASGPAKTAFARPASWSIARLNCSRLPVSKVTTVVVGSGGAELLVLDGGGVALELGELLEDVEVAVLVWWDVDVDVLWVEDEVDEGGGGGGGELVGCWWVVVVGFEGMVVTVGAAPPPKFHEP